MGALFAALVYLLAVLAAFHFFGKMVFRALAPGIQSEAGVSVACGIAAYLALCGPLEFAQIATRGLFLFLVGIGAIGQLILWLRNRTGLSRAGDWLGECSEVGRVAFVLFAICYALFLVNAAVWRYSFIDDMHGYLIYPERILAEGSIGRDHFNFRRIESGLAGGSYLYVLFRAALDISQTRLADVGVGSACLLLLMYSWARELGVRGVRLAIILTVTLAIVAFSPIINNTPETVGKAMLLALLRIAFLMVEKPLSVRYAVLLGLMFFTCIALKTTYLPEACAVLAAFYGSAVLKHGIPDITRSIAVSAAAALAFMLPWMLVSHAVANTLWYPLLGTGTLSSDEASGIVSVQKMITDGGRVVFLLVPGFVGAFLAWQSRELRSKRYFFLAVAACSLLFTILSQLKFTVFGYRYGHAGAAAVLLFFLPFLVRDTLRLLAGVATGSLVGCALIVMVVSKSTNERWLTGGSLFHRNPAASSELALEAARYRALQQAVPAGAPIVVLLTAPAILDYGRNPISVMDHAGKMGPGKLPEPDRVSDWVRYLKSLGFRYVSYSYGDEALLDAGWAANIVRDFSRKDSYSAFMVADAQAATQMRQTFVAMQKVSRTVYDDGKVFVIQLP